MKEVKAIVKTLPLVVVAIIFIGVSINMFLGPHHIAAGGVSGIGILVESVFQIDRALTVLILNLLMLVLTYIFLGKTVFINTVIGSMLLPISLAVVPEVMVTTDIFLSVTFGSAIFAVGVATLYKIGASGGGTTIPPLIFKKYFGLNTAIGLFVTDIIIVIFNVFVFSMEAFFYAVLSLIITSIVMSYIETGIKRKTAVMIMSQTQTDDIKQTLLHDLNRGVTVFGVTGGYTDEQKNMLMVIVSNQQYQSLLKTIKALDPDSFVIAYNVSEVHGLGFNYYSVV